MSHSRLLIFIPTYNERGNVERMAREISALDLDADILFLDDNSPDRTGETLDRLAAQIPRMSVIHRSGKQGIGSAHQIGIAWAYDGGYDVLISLDCDFTHDPKDIPRLLAALEGYDVAVGSRYLKRGSLPGWNLVRRSLTLFGHFLTTRLLGLPQDASGAFRAYDLHRIDRDLFSLVPSRSYSFFFESLFVLARNGLQINEIPIVLPARTYGSSKLTLKDIFGGGSYIFWLTLASLLHPERFRLSCAPARAEGPGSAWDAYWSRKAHPSLLAYDMVAAAYRLLVIRPNLVYALRRAFPWGGRLLHAGCGSGQADATLPGDYEITAVDLSAAALRLYAQNNPANRHVAQGNIFKLPFADASFDGVYNLGVMEHFSESDIEAILREFRRVLRSDGKVVLFWPHSRATSVAVLDAAHVVLKHFGRTGKLHPDEITRLKGREHAQALLNRADLRLVDYQFGWRDFFVQAVVVGTGDGTN